MYRRPSRQHNRFLPWVLFLAMALRSLVAPGYEFVNDGHHGEFSLGIAWCPGLNGINLVQGLEGADHSHEPDSSETKNGDHFTATCGLWTGNASFVNHSHLFNEGLLDPDRNLQTLAQPAVRHHSHHRRSHPPRAPPVPANA